MIICATCGQRIADAPTCESCGQAAYLDDRYRLISILGEGASGLTYRAERVADREAFAIKELAIRTMESVKVQELFEREASVLESLDHPSIPNYIEDFVAGEGRRLSLYLVQELVEGQTLADEMDERRFDEEDALDVLESLLEVLSYLHELGQPVIHRDIKPKNIMRRDVDGRLMLIDFGSVRAAVQEADVGGSTIAGTFGYMAPEQLVGRASPSTDIYSAAVLVVALLTREDPADLVDDDHQLRWESACDVSEPSAELLRSMLRANPSERASDASALVQRVRAILSGEVEQTRRDSGEVEQTGRDEFFALLVDSTGRRRDPSGPTDAYESSAPGHAGSAEDPSVARRRLAWLHDRVGPYSVTRAFAPTYAHGQPGHAVMSMLLTVIPAGWLAYWVLSDALSHLSSSPGLSEWLALAAFVIPTVGFCLHLFVSGLFPAVKLYYWRRVAEQEGLGDHQFPDGGILERTMHDEKPGPLAGLVWIGFATIVGFSPAFLGDAIQWARAPERQGGPCDPSCQISQALDSRGCCEDTCPQGEVWRRATGTCEPHQPRGLAISCPEGMQRHETGSSPVDFQCCWPGQTPAEGGHACTGEPDCPEPMREVKGTCVTDEPSGLTVVPAGTYTIGSPPSEPGRLQNEPVRDVTITRHFSVERTEVTQEEWERVMGVNPSYFPKCGPNCPVERVSWYDAMVYANRKSRRDGLETCYELDDCSGNMRGGCPEAIFGGEDDCEADFVCESVDFAGLGCRGWRLPTDAEWEVAARAGTRTAVYTGPVTWRNDVVAPRLDEIAWYGGDMQVHYEGAKNCTDPLDEDGAYVSCGTHRVAQKTPNPWGLYDVIGNVYEHTMDTYSESLYAGRDPLAWEPSPDADHIIRGCSYLVSKHCRAAHRWADPVAYREERTGLRLVRTIP